LTFVGVLLKQLQLRKVTYIPT